MLGEHSKASPYVCLPVISTCAPKDLKCLLGLFPQLTAKFWLAHLTLMDNFVLLDEVELGRYHPTFSKLYLRAALWSTQPLKPSYHWPSALLAKSRDGLLTVSLAPTVALSRFKLLNTSCLSYVVLICILFLIKLDFCCCWTSALFVIHHQCLLHDCILSKTPCNPTGLYECRLSLRRCCYALPQLDRKFMAIVHHNTLRHGTRLSLKECLHSFYFLTKGKFTLT